MIYLAVPYTHPDPAVRDLRYQQATRTTADLMNRGHVVYSPITYTHPIERIYEETLSGYRQGDFDWIKFDEHFMSICDSLIVLKLNGWDLSTGVRREIEYFTKNNKPIEYIYPLEMSIQ